MVPEPVECFTQRIAVYGSQLIRPRECPQRCPQNGKATRGLSAMLPPLVVCLQHYATVPIAQTGADITLFIALTGCRWSEAAELTWDCVNLKDGSWHIADPKNHNPVTFPLSAPARAMLESRPRIKGNDYVFPGRSKTDFIKDARTTMAEVSKLAGLHLTHHDLRRTFIAIGIKLKIEMWKLKLLTNHISKGDVTVDHYTETGDLRYLSDESEQIAGWIVEQGKIATGSNVVQLRGAK